MDWADEIAGKILEWSTSSADQRAAIANALRAEREACAKIADDRRSKREAELMAENKRLRDALIRARDQIVSQQAMPDPPTYIDEALTSASR